MFSFGGEKNSVAPNFPLLVGRFHHLIIIYLVYEVKTADNLLIANTYLYMFAGGIQNSRRACRQLNIIFILAPFITARMSAIRLCDTIEVLLKSYAKLGIWYINLLKNSPLHYEKRREFKMLSALNSFALKSVPTLPQGHSLHKGDNLIKTKIRL